MAANTGAGKWACSFHSQSNCIVQTWRSIIPDDGLEIRVTAALLEMLQGDGT